MKTMLIPTLKCKPQEQHKLADGEIAQTLP